MAFGKPQVTVGGSGRGGGGVSPSNKSYGPQGLGENSTLVLWENAKAAVNCNAAVLT